MANEASEGLLAELRAEMARQRRRTPELAAIIGRSRGTTWRKLNGHARFTADEFVKAGQWLGVSLDELAKRPAA